MRALILALALSGAAPAWAGGEADVERGTAIITTGSGVHSFSVEIADDPAEQARGLMFREHLPEDSGMLFLFDYPRPARFWMKNTLIPLDMLFIEEDGTILRIARETIPHDLTPRQSGGPVIAVLELAGGVTEALSILPGDQVRWTLDEETAPVAAE